VPEDLAKPQTAIAPDGQAVTGSMLNVPNSWWSAPTNIQLSDWFTLYRLPQPVQAVRFTYHGAATQMRLRDLANRRLLVDRPVRNQETVCLTAARIDEISFVPLSQVITLQDFSTLDLFSDRGLEWQVIAEIQGAETVNRRLRLEAVAPRYGTVPSLGENEWMDLCRLVREARHSSPPVGPSEPIMMQAEPPARAFEALTPWQTLELTLGLRWEFACLLGLGFFDGPRRTACALDRIDTRRALQNRPARPLAYRVRCNDRRLSPSNIVVCPPYSPGALAAPGVPNYSEALATLTSTDKIEAMVTLKWIQHDFNAIGVEVEERVSASPWTGEAPRIDRFECRSSDPSAPPFTGNLTRRLVVPWHDVTLKARARALDGWDRASAFSPWTAETPLSLRHNPSAPPLDSAKYVDGRVTLTLQPPGAEVPAWTPDPIVRAAQGTVIFYRRDPDKPLKTAEVTLSGWSPADGDALYKAHLIPDSPASFFPQDFAGGILKAGTMSLNVKMLSSTEVHFELIPDGGNTITVFGNGKGTLYQDMGDPSLWIKCHELPAGDLREMACFGEPLSFPTGTADVLQYACRVAFLGRLGPMSNQVSDFRIPEVPNPPPPFTVELKGTDFYDRTMVKLILTAAVPQEALLEVRWALGDYAAAPNDFAQKAVAGFYGVQKALNRTVLFELLPLPLDRSTGHPLTTLTIGIQQVNASGGQSGFVVVKI
jgi:hypothetical protein